MSRSAIVITAPAAGSGMAEMCKAVQGPPVVQWKYAKQQENAYRRWSMQQSSMSMYWSQRQGMMMTMLMKIVKSQGPCRLQSADDQHVSTFRLAEWPKLSLALMTHALTTSNLFCMSPFCKSLHKLSM